MEYSTSTISGSNSSTNVENCTCPVGYSGLSCERCSSGYTRAVPYGSAYSACVPCKCNNHASTCNPDNGICQECQHSTTGRFTQAVLWRGLSPPCKNKETLWGSAPLWRAYVRLGEILTQFAIFVYNHCRFFTTIVGLSSCFHLHNRDRNIIITNRKWVGLKAGPI